MTTNFLWIPSGDENTASARLRAYVPARALDEYYGVASHFPPVHLAESPQVLIVQRKFSQDILDLVAKAKQAGTTTILDLADPLWEGVFRLEPGVIDDAIERFDLVSVPTKVLQREITKHFPNVQTVVLPDFVEPVVFSGFEAQRSTEKRVGWIGAIHNADHLRIVHDALRELREQMDFTLRIISRGNEIPALEGLRCEYVEWRIDRAHIDLAECDIAILPLQVNNVTRGKSANRLLFCMGLGVPTVCSNLRSYAELASQVPEAARIARNTQEWVEGMQALIENRDIAADLGQEHVLEHYTPQQVCESWSQLLALAPSDSPS